MKQKIINFKKVIISLLTVLALGLSFSLHNYVVALENTNIETRSVERLVCTADKGLGSNGYVTCTVLIDYNIQAGTYTVAGFYLTPHFSSAFPGLKIDGTPYTVPGSRQQVTNGYVTVHFTVENSVPGIVIGRWDYSCKVSI